MSAGPTPLGSDEPAEMAVVVREDGEGGRTLVFKDAQITPLGYADLKAARLHQSLTVPFQLRNAAVVATDLETEEENARVSVTTTLQSPFSGKAIGLVHGGWIPAGLAVLNPSTIILIDRNILSDIEGRFRDGVLTTAQGDFLDFFAHYPVRLNPLLCVMEGNQRRRLDRGELNDELKRICAKLTAALPNATIMAGETSVSAIDSILDDTRASTAAYEGFLLEIADDLADPVSRKRLPAAWSKVVEASRRHGVRPNSIVLLAVLSAVAVPGGVSPARSILKFRKGYTQGEAYGALADLRALEILCVVLALFPQAPALFCTGDRALALLWTGMQASGFNYTGKCSRCDLDPVEDLLPAEAKSWWRDLVEVGDAIG